MTMGRRKLKRSEKLPLLIGSIPFLLAAVDATQQGDLTLAIVNFLMTITNLLALRFIAAYPVYTNVLLFFLNGIAGLFLGYSYYLAGKKGLPYAWAVVAGIYWIAAIVFYRKKKRAVKDQVNATSTSETGS